MFYNEYNKKMIYNKREENMSRIIQWHPAFYSGLELELREFKDDLIFETEYELSRKPLRMDVLIIKKKQGTKLKHPFASFFRDYNIIEYKSPKDNLTIDDFYKVIGYALFYKSLGRTVNSIPIESLSVSIFKSTYPRNLFEHLRKHGDEIIDVADGIYEIRGESVPVQVVVTGKLSQEGHSVLKILQGGADQQTFKSFINEVASYETSEDRQNIASVLEVCISANDDLYRMIKEDDSMSEKVKSLLEQEYEERENIGMERGKADSVRNLMKNLKLTAEQAMDALGIPKSDYNKYLTML